MSSETESNSFSLGSLVTDHRVDLAPATVDCRKLFRDEETEAAEGAPNQEKIFKLRHNKSGILHLRPLDPLRCTDPEQQYEFLPQKIYVVAEDRNAFHDILTLCHMIQ